MRIGKQHLSVISGAADGHVPVHSAARRRGVGLAIVALAVLLLGAAAGGLLSPQPGAGGAAQGETPAPERNQAFVYFPSQYVNQATEIEEHIEAF